MVPFLLRRILSSIPVFLGITIITFSVIHLSPGEPAGLSLEMNANAADIAQQLHKEYGLDRPLHVQYFDWLRRVVTFDFGRSMSKDRRPVLEKIGDALPITLLINGIEILLVFLIAVPIGILGAVKPGSLFDRITTVGSFSLYSAPAFWIALLLMMLFGIQWELLPISGIGDTWYDESASLGQLVADTAPYLVLPILTILFSSVAGLTRYVRMAMLEVLQADYIRTARAKGLSPARVLLVHGLRNGLLPIITLIGLMLPGLIGGSVILESVYALPGMGRLFYGAVMMRDYSTLMAILSIASILTLAGNLLADILYAAADPRIRTQFSGKNL